MSHWQSLRALGGGGPRRLEPILSPSEGGSMRAPTSGSPAATDPLLGEDGEDAREMVDTLDPTLEPDLPGMTYGPLEWFRELIAELLWVKAKKEDYKRPYLRFPGHVIEVILLASILGSIVLLAVDSFDELDVLRPESHCWKTCCLPNIGHCDADTCLAHKGEPNDTVCRAAQRFATIRDNLLWYILIIFTAEYVLRLWTCVELEQFSHAVKGRLRWMAQPIAILDLLSIAPFYIIFFMQHGKQHQHHGSTALFRIMRLMRVLAVLRLERSTKAWRLMMHVFGRKADELSVVVFVTAVFLILISSLMYYLENDVNPEMFPHIPGAMWWAVNCLTTIGYGDVYPKTAAGRVLASFASFVGVGLFALPAGILGAGFTECYTDMKRLQLERRKKRQRIINDSIRRVSAGARPGDKFANIAAAAAQTAAGVKTEAALDKVAENSAPASRSASVASVSQLADPKDADISDLMDLENDWLSLERIESARIESLEKSVKELALVAARQEQLLTRIAEKILVSSY